MITRSLRISFALSGDSLILFSLNVMITGAHSVIYSTDTEADRAFLRDVLKLTHVDVGHGWLIFGLPPAEVAVHPSGENDVHEFFLMCDESECVYRRAEETLYCLRPSPGPALRLC